MSKIRLGISNNYDYYAKGTHEKVGHMQEQMGRVSRETDILRKNEKEMLQIENPVTEMKWCLPPIKTHNMRNSSNRALRFRCKVASEYSE